MSNQGENLKIIIVVWNRLDHTMKTINSLLRTVPKAKLFIYDNASTEKGLYPYYETLLDSKITIGNKNVGWGKAVNEAYEDVTCYDDDYILLSNNDVEYSDGWYDKAIALYEKYPKIGVLGLWKHKNHGVMQDYGDLVTKDQMPGTCWLMKPAVLKDIGTFVEHGPCLTKGGNGEDVDYCLRADKKDYWVAGPKEDLAIHLDGYEN